MAIPLKYQTKEVLNKVLNTGEDALKVDIDNVTLTTEGGDVAIEVHLDKAEDSVLMFSNTSSDGSGTSYVPLVDSSGHLQVDALSSALPSGAATAANQSTIIGHVDGIETLITSTNSKIDTFDAVLDNILTKNTEIDAVLDTIKTDTGTIDSDTDAIKTAVELIDDTVAVLGTTTYSETSTKGNVVGAVRNDTLATLADTDNEIAPLQVNKSGALYTVEETGQLGAIYESGTTAVSGEQIIAIQFLEDTKFTTLTPASAAFIGTASGDGDNIVNTEVFPQGMTIFGRWTAFTLVTGGRVIAYKGVW